MVISAKLKSNIFFALKVLVALMLLKPILSVIVTLIFVGLIRLFILGRSVHYADPIRDISVLKKGDIILTGKDSVWAAFYIQVSNVLTRKIKHRFWSHAAIYKGDGKLIEAQPAGIIERDIQDYLNDGSLIRAFRHRYITDEALLDRLIEKCESKVGDKYGWGGLVFFTLSSFTPISLNFVFENPIVDQWLKFDNKYFCSELIVDSYDEIGYPVSPFDGWRVKPSDFISNPLLEPVNP